jgi:hypothetical protein
MGEWTRATTIFPVFNCTLSAQLWQVISDIKLYCLALESALCCFFRSYNHVAIALTVFAAFDKYQKIEVRHFR